MTEFHAQNAANAISVVQMSKIFRGQIPPDPPKNVEAFQHATVRFLAISAPAGRLYFNKKYNCTQNFLGRTVAYMSISSYTTRVRRKTVKYQHEWNWKNEKFFPISTSADITAYIYTEKNVLY